MSQRLNPEDEPMSVPLDFDEERFDPDLIEADEIMERHEQLSIEVTNSVQSVVDKITKKKMRDFKKTVVSLENSKQRVKFATEKLREAQAFCDDADKEIQTSLPKHKVLRINTKLPIGIFYQALEVILLYKGDLDEVREKGEEFRKLLLAKEDSISKTMYQALKYDNQKPKEDYESLKAKRDSENDATEARKMAVEEIAKLEEHLREYIAKDKSAQDTIKTLEEKAGEANKSYLEISQSMEKLEKEVADRSSTKDSIKGLQNELEMSQFRHQVYILQLEKARKGSTELHERLKGARRTIDEQSERLSEKSLEISDLRRVQETLRAEAKKNQDQRRMERELLKKSQSETFDALDNIKSRDKKIAEGDKTIKNLQEDRIRLKETVEGYRKAHQISLGNYKQNIYDLKKEFKEEQATWTRQLEQERATHQAQMKQQQAAHEKKLEQERDTHRVQLEQQQAKHEKRTEQEDTAYQRQLERDRAIHQKQLEQDRVAHQKQLEQDRTAHQEQLKEQQTTYGKKLENQRATHEKSLERQQANHDEKMKQEKSAHQNQLKEERVIHQKEVKKLEQERITHREI
ncbi:hypothetical protein EAE96_004478 [Botrytis aclada]|nr:hypothetical protein EAE96_004478 [Botrytis aclada]